MKRSLLVKNTKQPQWYNFCKITSKIIFDKNQIKLLSSSTTWYSGSRLFLIIDIYEFTFTHYIGNLSVL